MNEPVMLAIIVKGAISTFLCSGGLYALNRGFKLFMYGVGEKEDDAFVQIGKLKASAKTIGSFVMITSCVWAFFCYKTVPIYKRGDVEVASRNNVHGTDEFPMFICAKNRVTWSDAKLDHAKIGGKTYLMWASDDHSNTDPTTKFYKYDEQKGDYVVYEVCSAVPPDDKESLLGNFLIEYANNGDIEYVKLLTKDGADINKQEEGTGKTALIKAATKGHIETVKFLLSKNADVNVVTPDGKTALGEAESNGHSEIIVLLKEAGGRNPNKSEE